MQQRMLDAVEVIAKAAGFVISADGLQRAQAGSEISEEELESVAGGLMSLMCDSAGFTNICKGCNN